MKKFSLGLEAIEFQKDETFNNFVKEFSSLKKKKTFKQTDFKGLEELTFSSFNIKISIEENTVNDSEAAVLKPFWLQINNIIHHEKRKTIYKQLVNEEEFFNNLFNEAKKFRKSNLVDLKTAKISGPISSVTSYMVLSANFIKKFSAEEMAAVYLHEIGHIFTFFESMVKLTTVNMVLNGLCLLAEKRVSLNKEVHIKTSEELLGVPEGSLTLINETTSSKVVATILLDATLSKPKSVSNSYFYDMVSSEQLADQFVSRLGGGRYLIMALDKLNKQTYEKIMPWRFNTLLQRLVMLSIGTFINPIIGVIVLTFILYEFNKMTISVYHTSGYDDEKVRLLRIRNDMSLQLKSPMSDDDKRALILHIEKMDEIIQATKTFEGAYGHIAKFLNLPSLKKKQEIYNLQRDLEDIAFNDLFIKSEKLRLV